MGPMRYPPANGQRNTQGVTSTYSPTLGRGIAMGLHNGPDRMGGDWY